MKSPTFLTTEQLAYMWGVSKTAIAEWSKGEGWLVPAKLKRGKFDAHTANRLYIENQIIPRYTKPDIEGESLDEAKRRREIAKADIEEMKSAQLRGDLIERCQAVQWVIGLVSDAKTALLAMPRRMAPILYGKEIRDIETLTRKEINAALNKLARATK